MPEEASMDITLLTFVTGLATALLAFAFGFPQFFRVRRTGSAEGVSLASVTNSLVSTSAWLLYGFQLRDVWVITTSLVGLPAIIATIHVVRRVKSDHDGMWVPLVYAGLLTGTALLTPVAPWLFPAVLGCSIVWFVTPAALTAWRSADVSGLATGTWWLLVVDGLVAGAYGVLAHVTAYLVYAAIALVGSAVVLARLHWPWEPDCGECAPLPGCTCPA
jgi:uncharacterized protein with PQ loop repeat